MYKLCILFALLVGVFGAPAPAPAPAPGLLSTPVLAALPSPLLTATSSQFIARNYNNLGLGPITYASAPVVYPTHAVVSI
ncbi:neuropeptide-like 3 [Vespa mandarinia]|uniref:neuropeptide-like 3 n=1 Tax=Vespa mandarinia TaxID=7446 RepID=UPI0016151DD1|nr:neuropeptide-like 3 [Vespa mandarinia]